MKHKVTEINLDLDGVHADFETGVKKLTGGLPHEIEKRHMWKAIAKAKTFFEDLDVLPDALELFQYVQATGVPTKVLTGMPTINDGAGQKRRWVARELCDKIEVVVLPSKDKRLHAGPGKVLIDDRQDMITAWEIAGGIGILHRSTVETIGRLKALGL
jgi:hypothetical protein